MLRPISTRDRYGKFRQFPLKITNRAQFEAAVQDCVLGAYMPEQPFITRKTPLVAFGSCFAGNVSRDLSEGGYRVQLMGMSDRLFTAFALRDFVSTIKAKDMDLAVIRQVWGVTDEEILATRAAIMEGATVIITFGLSVVWVDKETDKIIHDPSRKDGMRLIVDNPDRFEMRPTDVSENFDVIMETVNDLREMNPFTKIILTLSPIPLVRAVCDYPVVAADAISKATLRCALHQVTTAGLKDVYYYPSFELLRGLATMVEFIWFGDQLLNHVRREWIDYTLSKFKAAYCAGEEAIPAPLYHLGMMRAKPAASPSE